MVDRLWLRLGVITEAEFRRTKLGQNINVIASEHMPKDSFFALVSRSSRTGVVKVTDVKFK